MAFSDDELRELVRDPKEGFGTELKQWIDPATAAGEAKIAKGCIALRNNNGGCMIIGFDDDGKPSNANKPANVRKTYHVDQIQAIVGRYAGTLFEISVSIIERDGIEYPVISVDGGVESPVATKRALADPNKPKGPPLVREDTVYVRTLESNHTVSTSAAKQKDFDRVTKTCFDNREADVGAFIRRHLANVGKEQILSLFNPTIPPPTAIERAIQFLDVGVLRFEAALADQNIQLPQCGFREAALVIDGEFSVDLSDRQTLWRLEAEKPKHNGWTPWVDTSNASYERQRPHVIQKGWEALIVDIGEGGFFSDMIDFWRISFDGQFYHVRGLEDDMPHPSGRKPEPNTVLDFYLQINRTAEIISSGLSFAQTLGCDPKSTNLAFAMRWSGLKGRRLASWAVPERDIRHYDACHDDEIQTDLIVPMETPLNSVAPIVETLVRPLFSLFGGMKFNSSVIEGIVKEVISRRF